MRAHRGHRSRSVNPYVVDSGAVHSPIAALSGTPGYPCATQNSGQWYRNNGPSGGLVPISVNQAMGLPLCASYSGPAPQIGSTGTGSGGSNPANTGTGPAPSTPSGPSAIPPGGNTQTVYAPVRKSPFAPRTEQKTATKSSGHPLQPLYPQPTAPQPTAPPPPQKTGVRTPQSMTPFAPVTTRPPLSPIPPRPQPTAPATPSSPASPPATAPTGNGTAVPPPIVFSPTITAPSVRTDAPQISISAPTASPPIYAPQATAPTSSKPNWFAIGALALAAVVLLKK